MDQVGQGDLEVVGEEFVQLEKVVEVLLVQLAQEICLPQAGHQENDPFLCYWVEMLPENRRLEAQLFLLQTSGQTVWFSLTAVQIDSETAYYMELQLDFDHAILF